MNKLQELINRWKIEVDFLSKSRNNTKSLNKRAVLLGCWHQLRKNISEAELLLKEETAKDLKKHDFMCECNACIKQRSKAC